MTQDNDYTKNTPDEQPSHIEGAVAAKISAERATKFNEAARLLCETWMDIGNKLDIQPEELVAVLPVFCHLLLSRTHAACAVLGMPMKAPYDRLIDCLCANIDNLREYGARHGREITSVMTHALSNGKPQ